jgi:hypothetical protein
MASTISSSVYDIQKKWIEEVAPKYLPVDDINMLKVGQFGYMNEVMANSVEDNLHMLSIYSNEIFPNRAVLPNSIYAYSGLAKFDDFNAKPAILPFMLAVKKKDIIKYGEQKTGYKELNISRFSKMVLEGNIPFMIDYDIRIIATPNKDKTDHTLSAQYVLDIVNPISEITTPYIKTVVLNEMGDEFLFIRLIGHQLDRTERRFTIYTNDVVENLFFEAEFEGKLAGFNVYYTDPKTGVETQLEKYFVDSYTPDSKYFCFYSYTGENKINIQFSAFPNYFRPEFNSELKIEIFTTLGGEGNFTYKGTDAQFTFYDENGTNDYSDILSYTQVLGDSIGGLERLEIKEIKENVIKEFSSRGNLITESDLNNYFNSLSENCKIYFTKKRDDLIQRLYSAFILLKDDDQNILPTNTVNLLLHDYQFDHFNTGSNVHTLKTGTLVELYDLDNRTFTIPKTEYTKDILIRKDADPDNYMYGTPFLIKATTNPYFVSYYLNSVFDTYIMQFKYLNKDATNEFIVNNMSIERNAIKSSEYTVTADLITTLDKNEIFTFDSKGSIVSNLENVKIKCLIEESGSSAGYFNFELVGIDEVSGAIKIQAKLETDDLINSDDKLNISNSIYSVGSRMEVLREGFNIPSTNIKFNICVFYNGYDTKSKSMYKDVFPEMDNYCLTNIYETEKNVELFKNLNSIMTSNIIAKVEPDYAGLFYKVKSVPVVRYLYLQDDDNMKRIIQLLDYFKDILNESLDVVENNFGIDMKFYNTYGPSQYFTIGSGGTKLNKTSISLKVNIKLFGDITTSFITDIKKYITQFVEETNNSDSNFLYMSNLMRHLEEQFPDILYMQFVGFNDYDATYQIIEDNFEGIQSLRKEQVINFIPEYLNVNRRAITENGVTTFEPDIQIKFV